MENIKCIKYKLYQASGNFDGEGTEIYESLRAGAVSKYMNKHNIPIDLNTNAYFIDCFSHGGRRVRVSTYEFNTYTFDKVITDDRGAYTMRVPKQGRGS